MNGPVASSAIADPAALEQTVRRAVERVRVTDIHTHLFPPSHGGLLLLWGVDELLTYHYLVSELFAAGPPGLTPGDFYALPKSRQADWVWQHVFLRRGAMSEAARGVITSLNLLGLDVAGRDLEGIRKWFAQQTAGDYLRRVFDLANIDYAVMTNDPFEPEEVRAWDSGAPGVGCLKAALRVDTMILHWPQAARTMRAAGYRTSARPTARCFAQARRFLLDWAGRIDPLYLAASLPPSFAYPSRAPSTRVLEKVVLPVARELGLPLAMMIGVVRRINPPLGWAGDGMGAFDTSSLLNLLQRHPDGRFLVTLLSRADQQDLCVLAGKFPNLHVFGCWWFCNTPSLIAEITRLRLELLGANFTCQHSDARVLDQVLYKWAHSKAVVADVLAEQYARQFRAGWRPTEDEIRRDVRRLFGGAFEEFLRR